MFDGLCLALALRLGMTYNATTVHINMTYNSDIYMCVELGVAPLVNRGTRWVHLSAYVASDGLCHTGFEVGMLTIYRIIYQVTCRENGLYNTVIICESNSILFYCFHYDIDKGTQFGQISFVFTVH